MLEYQDQNGVVTIHEALKTNWNFVRLCLGNPAFGDAANAFRGSNVSGLSEGYLPVLDFAATFGFRWGLRLAAGTRQRLVLRVRDLTTLVDEFNAIVYGFERSK